MTNLATVWLRVSLFLFAAAVPSLAHAQPLEPDYRQLALRHTIETMPTDKIEIYACGSKGAAPLARISGWTDYMKCHPDELGLREVYIEFDTELMRMVDNAEEQYGQSPWFKKYAGTRVANFAVVMSVLFDENGVARKFRAVTDQRAEAHERSQAFMFRLRVLPKYGSENWTCVDRERTSRETPVGNQFINQFCEARVGGKLVTMETHLFRKRGQTGLDLQGRPVAADYESLGIWEVTDLAFIEGAE